MRSLLIMLSLIATLAYMGCNNKTEKTGEENSKTTDTSAVQPKQETGSQNTVSVEDIITAYLGVKDALAGDNAKEASTAADRIAGSIENVNTSTFSAEQKTSYDELKADIKEHAEHIQAASGDIGHQREHFDLLSADMIDLVKATGSSRTLYRDFCPMYNNKKGAYWLSETKEIQNPYYGDEMLKCGELKEEIRPKG